MSEEQISVLKVRKMVKWAEFVSTLETSGGQLVFLLALLILLFMFSKLGFQAAESQIPIVVGAAIGILNGKMRSKRDDAPMPLPPQPQPQYYQQPPNQRVL